MALLTEKAIMAAFEEMLDEMPFDKITVTALAKRSSVSTNAFYYHYDDIFMLLREWLKLKLPTPEVPSSISQWCSDVKDFFWICQKHQKKIAHIFSSLSRDQLERHVFKEQDDGFVKIVENKVGDKEVDQDKITEIAQFCRFSFTGFYLKFLWNGMDLDIDKAVDKLGEYLDCFIESSIEMFLNKK